MKRVLILSALVALVAGCTPTEPAPVTPPRISPPPTQAPLPRPMPPRNDPRDTCGAKAMQHLVGKPRTEIPVPVDVSRRRVACTTCPVTMDFREDRLNIFFDADSGIIREVKCG